MSHNRNRSDCDQKTESLKRKLSLSENDDTDEDDSENEITYVEEDSESEPELECDYWDIDCRIVDMQPETSVIGYHLMPTCSRNPDDNPHKKIKLDVQMHPKLLTNKFYDDFRTCWRNNEKFHEDSAELIVDPYKICVINDFLESEKFLKDLKREFNEIDWNTRNMDLYEFFQSRDLKYLTELPAIATLYRFLESDVMKWVAKLTGYELTHISTTCSFYSNTDHLLVHDDRNGDRAVAFVLYLTEEDGWSEGKGGALQLLSMDPDGQTSQVTRNIFPANNQFVFFPVTYHSYHQVAEVTSLSDCRMSINGWFHSKAANNNISENESSVDAPSTHTQIKGLDMDIDLHSWLSEDYLNCTIIKQIQEYFEEHSEICLKKFLKNECFTEIAQTLTNNGLQWCKVGPSNRRCYEILKSDDLPQVLDRFLNLFQSKQMFSLLKRYTDLDLDKEGASMRFEFQRWTPGCYALLNDHNYQESKELDLVIYFGCQNDSDVIGAKTQYVAIDEEVQESLITLRLEENVLNIVYRDTAKFTKYFSKQSRSRCFYTMVCSYSE